MDVPYHEQPQLHVEAPHRAALLTYPGNLNKALEEAQANPSKTMFGVAHGIPSVYLTKVRFIVMTSWQTLS
jgi:4-hydroxy-2-oxoheptanedioate aldolase